MRPMLLLFTQSGCPACEAAIPEWERFKSRNPRVMAIHLDADGPYPAQLGLKRIKATPLYVLRDGETERGVTHEGVMKAEQLEKWATAATGALE